MDPVNIASIILTFAGSKLLQSVLKVARREVLIALVTFLFILAATLCLTLSGIVFKGWWQDFFLEAGVGLLIAGIVDVAVLGALHGLIEGTEDKGPKYHTELGPAAGVPEQATHEPHGTSPEGHSGQP